MFHSYFDEIWIRYSLVRWQITLLAREEFIDCESLKIEIAHAKMTELTKSTTGILQVELSYKFWFSLYVKYRLQDNSNAAIAIGRPKPQ